MSPVRSLLVAVLLLAPTSALATTSTSASETIALKHDAVVELVNRKADDASVAAALDELIDYGWLAEASLGGPDNYAKVCAPRCAEFEALLAQLVRHSYLKMVRKAKQAPLEIIDQVEGKGGLFKVTTKTSVSKNGRLQNLTVEYVMHRVGDRWQVRDILTDGVSLVRTYRHEFHKLAKAEGIDGIIARLEQQLAG